MGIWYLIHLKSLDLFLLILLYDTFISFIGVGNELSGNGVGAMVHAEQYGNDLIELRGIIDNLYRRIQPKPLLVAPGGFFDKEWFAKLLKETGSQIVNVMTLHMYNLGPGNFNLHLYPFVMHDMTDL